MKRAIKYIINISFACFSIWISYLSFAIIVRIPTSGEFKDLAWHQFENTSLTFLVILSIITIINFIFERKVEKRKKTKDYLFLSFAQFVIQIISFLIYAYQFYKLI